MYVVDRAARGAVSAGHDGARAKQQALAFGLRAAGRHIALPVLVEIELRPRQQAAVVVLAMRALEQVHIAIGRRQQVTHTGDGRTAQKAEHAGAATVDLVDTVVHIQIEAVVIAQVIEAQRTDIAFLPFVLGTHIARSVNAIETQAQALLRPKALAHIGMQLVIGIGDIGGSQVRNRLGQCALGHHIDRAGHAGQRRHAGQQHIGAAHHLDPLKHLDRHRVGWRNAVEPVGRYVHRRHIQPAQVEVLQQVALVGREDHRRIVLQHILQRQRRPVLGQLAGIGIDMDRCLHDRGRPQNAQPRPLGRLAPGGQCGQVFALIAVAHRHLGQVDGGVGGCFGSTASRRSCLGRLGLLGGGAGSGGCRHQGHHDQVGLVSRLVVL